MSRQEPLKIGVLGGTFDPVHNGHLAMARAALDKFGLQRVIFVPAAVSPYKTGEPVASGDDRVAMLHRAIDSCPEYRISGIELERGGISYTIDTILELHRDREPGVEIFLIIGMDSLLEISGWERIGTLINLCRFIVVERPEFKPERLTGKNKYWAERIIRPDRSNIIKLSFPISSTGIREAVRAGRDPEQWVPPGVAAYIKEKGLYRL